MAKPQPVSILDVGDVSENGSDLIARYIKPHPSDRGRAYFYFPEYGYSVASIVRSLREFEGDVERTAAEREMPVDAIRAAVEFYGRYRDYIDARILLEDDWFNPDLRSK